MAMCIIYGLIYVSDKYPVFDRKDEGIFIVIIVKPSVAKLKLQNYLIHTAC